MQIDIRAARKEYVGMLTNGLPAPLNISLVAGKETARDFYVFNEDGSKRDMRFYTFSGLVTTVEGKEYELRGSVSGAQENCVTMQIPALPMGTHRYSLNAASDTGEIESFVSGVLGVQYPDLSALEIEPVESPTNAAIIKLPGDGGLVRALWAPTNLTEAAAKDAVAAMKRAESARDATLAALNTALQLAGSFNEALIEAVQVVNNYLWIGGINTGHYLRGEDGVTPHYGADGYWYIGEERVGKARGDDGITPHITNDGYWAFGSQKTNVRAAGRDGLDGASMRRIRINSLDELPEQEERGVYYYLKTDNGWDKYVWLHPDGWVCVGEVNDIATSEIYGLMKYATDVQVDNGAPVGTNAEGQASVPLASTTVAGAGRLSAGIEITFGAEVGFDANKAYRVPVATMDSYGVGRLGINTTVDGAYVGFDSEGRWCVPWATLYTAGAIKLGSQYGQSNPMPYIVGIGATENHELANNYAFGGALQHRKPDSWRGTMAWLDDSMSQSQQYFGDMFYSGLLTSAQFSQSQNNGLELLAATTQRLAGVYLASSMSDSRTAAVPTISLVNLTFAKKTDVYTKEEADERYMSISGADSEYVKPDSSVFVRCGVGGPFILHKMSKSAFDALENRDANAVYLVKRA